MDLAFVESLEPAAAATAAAWRDGDAWLGGGTWLFSEPQPALRRLFDLHAFGWDPLSVADAGLEIAATCRLSELARFEPPADWPAARLIRSCCDALLGSFKVWNEATVGGNICLSLPAGPMIALAASLRGTCELWGADGTVSRMPAAAFVTGNRRNVLRRGSLLRSIVLPARALRGQTAMRQVSRTPLGRSAALVIGLLDPDDGAFTLTVTAAVTRPLQLTFDRMPSASELRDAVVGAEPPYFEDAHGSIAWREHLTLLLAQQVREQLA